MKKGSGFGVKAGALLSSMVVFSFIVALAAIAQAEYLIYMPFEKGEKWYCVQGNNGSFSHQGNLFYAYDFIKPGGENSFGYKIVSPVEGTVVSIKTSIPDYLYNDVASKDNNGGWGNTVLLKDTATGMYIRIAHMKKDSVAVATGDAVTIGQYLGQVGQTGISTDPHLHIQMQESDSASGQSVKFSFIEGPIDKGVTAKAEIVPKSFVLDDAADRSLGHKVTYYQATKASGYSNSSTAPNKTVGKTSWSKKMKVWLGAWYKWTFKLSEPGFYMIYAKVFPSPSADPAARYLLCNAQTLKEYGFSYVNQNAYVEGCWYLIFGMYLSSSIYYTIRLDGLSFGQYTKADGLMFVKLF